jgi:hypothetical protein
VRGVDDEDVDLLLDERGGALERVGADADGRADPQPAVLVLRRERKLDPLLDVLHGDQPPQTALGVDDGQLLDLVPLQDGLGLTQGGPDRRGDEVAARHHIRDRQRAVPLEAEVAVRQDADEPLVIVDDRNP